MDKRSQLAIRYDALKRFVMLNTMTGILPLYVVTEYPKSGGSWLSQMLSDYFAIPFPRNRAPSFQKSLFHGHIQYNPRLKNVCALHRDGRDIIVSLYFHSLFQNDKNSPLLVDRCRSDLPFNDYEDVQRNLPEFIEYVYERDARSRSPFRFTWPQFVQGWQSHGSVHARYEDLIHKGEEELARIVSILAKDPVDHARIAQVYSKYSFKNQSDRQPGKEDLNSFMRKGVPGDWKEKFTPEAAEVFIRYAGDQLIALGYETDNSWVQTL